jgi:hypothetical protein
MIETNWLDVTGTLVAIILTLFVFSYLLGDNVLYRLAEHVFVGVAVGYAFVVVFHAVLAPRLLSPMAEALNDGDWPGIALRVTPLILGLLLLTKPLRKLSWLGSYSVAVLLGVGAALAIGGALLGTLLPQVNATADLTHYVSRYGPILGLLSGLVVFVGTVGVLLHFYYRTDADGPLASLRQGLVRTWGGIGRWFILIAFSAILAATFMSRLSLLVGRIQFLLESARGLLGG